MRPKVTIVAGPNGSGKSSLIGELRRDPSNAFPSAYINADDIEKELAQTSSLSKAELERLAFQEARSLRALYRESLTSHAFETVFSHASNLLDMFRLQEDFEIELYCISTDRPELNVERVRLRVASGGHSIAEEKITARYDRSLRFWPLAAELADTTFIFDNSDHMTLIGLCLNGAWEPVAPEIPAYLQHVFVEPFQDRALERSELASQFIYADLLHPVAGSYTGLVLYVGRHYVLQQVEDPKHGPVTYCHDSILLDREIQPGWLGQEIVITYGATGYGLAQVAISG